MRIGDFDLNNKILVIAEIGNNHEGNFDRACEMIKVAAHAGAGAVKFQTIIPEKLVTVNDECRIKQLRKFQFSYEQFSQLSKVSQEQNVLFLSTPFDLDSVEALNLIVPAFKIASADNDFYPLIEAIAKLGKPIILSTGLADFEQISKTKSFIEHIWREYGVNQEMVIMHCVSSYPTQPQEANLLAIKTLQDEFGGNVGYSDHTLGITAAKIAVALGARIIEKHFTLDKNLSDFRDHQLSADPDELKNLIDYISEMTTFLGDGSLNPRKSEQALIDEVRRSIVALRDLNEGTTITIEDITWVRPAGGLPPGSEDYLLGGILNKSIYKGEKILVKDLRD